MYVLTQYVTIDMQVGDKLREDPFLGGFVVRLDVIALFEVTDSHGTACLMLDKRVAREADQGAAVGSIVVGVARTVVVTRRVTVALAVDAARVALLHLAVSALVAGRVTLTRVLTG